MSFWQNGRPALLLLSTCYRKSLIFSKYFERILSITIFSLFHLPLWTFVHGVLLFTYTRLLLRPFIGLFSRTTWVSRHQKGKPFWILLEEEMIRHDMMEYINVRLKADE